MNLKNKKCGCSSMVESFASNENVAGSSPVTRFDLSDADLYYVKKSNGGVRS